MVAVHIRENIDCRHQKWRQSLRADLRLLTSDVRNLQAHAADLVGFELGEDLLRHAEIRHRDRLDGRT